MNADEPTPGWLAAERDADLTLWLPGDVPMFFRRVPGKDWQGGNRFRVGARGVRVDEEPIHEVILAEPGYFYMATFPVTLLQYRAVAEECADLRERSDPSFFKGPYRPVETVSWFDAMDWCEWIMKNRDRLRLQGRKGEILKIGAIRLPWEAEWEIACRAGTDTEYYTGDGEAALEEAGWFQQNSEVQTHPLGEKAPNHWGLYDLYGNVWEWCRDLWDEEGYSRKKEGGASQDDETAWPADDVSPRVLRGGSWPDSALDCRSAIRSGSRAGDRKMNLGFRVCLFPRQADQPAGSVRSRRRREVSNRW